MFLHVNQCAAGYLKYFAYAQLQWISPLTQSVRVTTSVYGFSFFRFPTFPHQPLLEVISQALDRWSLIACGARNDGCMSAHQNNWNRGYLPFLMSRIEVAAERITSFICTHRSLEFWGFCWKQKRVESSDRNWSLRLQSRNNCAGRVNFVLVRSLTGGEGNQRKRGLKHDMGLQVWIRIIDSLRLIHHWWPITV